MLQIGDVIPTKVTVTDIDGKPVTLESFLGNYLVIYFYPKDETAGCTIEACELRDFNSEIEKLGAKVIGISKDKVRSHQKFRDNHKLNFTLLSDPDAALMKAFGIWIEKTFWGKKYMGTDRATFIVDPEGKIVHLWSNVMPLGHGKQVFEYLKTNINA